MGLVDFSSHRSPILVDASFLVCVYNRSEPYHAQCMVALQEAVGTLVTCEAVLVEAIYLLRRIPGAAEAILKNVGDQKLLVPFAISESALDVLQLYTKYRDTPCDFADACLIHLANQLDTGDILTLDSDFKHYRWRRNRRFRMLIPLEK